LKGCFVLTRFPLPAERVYVAFNLIASLCFGVVFAVNTLYYATTVRLDPLQLVLVGTMLEFSAFIFEVPTGIVADVFSRRLSIMIGYVLIGCAFIFEGLVPVFWAILASQFLWGLGITFTSGAVQAWLSDEIGEAQAARVFLRTARLEQAFGVVVIPISTVLAISTNIRVPIVAGGLGFLLLAAFLYFCMPEQGFRPASREHRSTWQHMRQIFLEGLQVVRSKPGLQWILVISVIFGAASESFDRLWQVHFLSFQFPTIGFLNTLNLEQTCLVWFGLIGLGLSFVVMPLIHLAERRVNTNHFGATARALLGLTLGLMVFVGMFALAGNFALALLGYWGARAMRSLIEPLSQAWINQGLESQTRATVLSMNAQADAVGQMAGGPMIGWLGKTSLRLALLAGAGLLLPALGVFTRTLRPSNSTVSRVELE
jgi:MFS transporter, DHA3 family, tetracycline resistance protein